MDTIRPTPPQQRLLDTEEMRRLRGPDQAAWRRWGPYLSERQWGTVREDYSAGGDAWEFLPHDQARSRAYRWGEDGLAGFGDDQLLWCLGLALWNGRDPILKERLFGLTNAEGNHGEDVKELYFYQDALPSHAYLRMLYKYPHAEYPYDRLVAENARRDRSVGEYEILDTGVFDHGRYFDVTVEYARAAPEDILMRVHVRNRAAAPATLHVLPQLWARNVWSWDARPERPLLRLDAGHVEATHPGMPARTLHADRATLRAPGNAPNPAPGAPHDPAAHAAPATWLFCDNETNTRRLDGTPGAARFPDGAPGAGPFKDGIDDHVVRGRTGATRPGHGTKAAAHHVLHLPAGGEATLRLRFRPADATSDPFADHDAIFARRLAETDAFYHAVRGAPADHPRGAPADPPSPAELDARLVQRQAFAGMIWSRQYYGFDVRRWLEGDPAGPPPPPERRQGRNREWTHLVNADIVSMPDKWEYPWYASWDLAFHAVVFALIDPDFAKDQMILLMRARCMHPNGQLPAYEWSFGDANPPVAAWAAWRVYLTERELTGTGDRRFLEAAFHKLCLNFGWWVNRKDAQDRNIFQGGFLGLDNIGIFDRSQPLPTGGSIDQADGTAWVAAYALQLMRIALELSLENPVYEHMAIKFFQHFLFIASAVNGVGEGGVGLWDPRDEFFYDVLRVPGRVPVPLRVRSTVGLLPMLAVLVLEPELMARVPHFADRARWFVAHRADLAGLISRWEEPGRGDTLLLSLLRGHRTKALLARALDVTEFLSPHGLRAISRTHAAHPYEFRHDGQVFSVAYLPAESDSRLFGGNSNWRGPIWLPTNYLLIESLLEFHRYYGNDFTVPCPTGSATLLTLREVAEELAARLTRLSLLDHDGKRPVMAAYPALQAAADGAELVLFHEYYDGDTGRGVGASHQTGWSGLVALLLQPRRQDPAGDLPQTG